MVHPDTLVSLSNDVRAYLSKHIYKFTDDEFVQLVINENVPSALAYAKGNILMTRTEHGYTYNSPDALRFNGLLVWYERRSRAYG